MGETNLAEGWVDYKNPRGEDAKKEMPGGKPLTRDKPDQLIGTINWEKPQGQEGDTGDAERNPVQTKTLGPDPGSDTNSQGGSGSGN